MSNDGNHQDVAGLLWARILDPQAPPIVIAEISGNHDGKKDRALELVRAAAHSGADIVKFQHYSADTITVKSNRPEFLIEAGSLWEGRTLWDLYNEAMTPWEWTEDLVAAAQEEGIPWFSSPFDETAVDFLETLNPPIYKVASFEIIDIPLIQKIVATGKPIIVSTGMAKEKEIDEAVSAIRRGSDYPVALLRTNSAYPASPSDMDLNAIPYLSERWGAPVGLSDHTLTHTAAVVATALGARVFEKHLTLNRLDGGPDAAFSLEPDELREYVSLIHEAHSCLGTTRLGPSEKEEHSARFRPSIRATANIVAGQVFTEGNIATVRPSGGIEPRFLPDVLGKKATRDIAIGEPLHWEVIS